MKRIKVTVRSRPISGGRRTLFLDYYPAVRVPESMKMIRQESLGMYVYDQPHNQIERRHNDTTLMQAEAIRCLRVQNIINDFATRISQQGLSMEQYMQFSGATIDSLKEQVRPDAIERIQSSLVLEEIAKAENIEVSDEELDKEFERLATAYRTDVESLKEYAAESEIQAIKDDLALQKAADLIMENVKERAKPKKKATKV